MGSFVHRAEAKEEGKVMAPKRRKILTPPQVAIETLWWHDASRVEGEVDTEPLVLMETGIIVYENAIEIGFSKQIECTEEWNTDNHKGDKIPRGMIIKRIRHGMVDVVPPEVTAYKERVNDPIPPEKGDDDASSA